MNTVNMYQGFRIARRRDFNTKLIKYIGTLQGLRLTNDTYKGLKKDIDDRAFLRLEMSQQGFSSKSSESYSSTDHFLTEYEIYKTVEAITGGNNHDGNRYDN
jgi:hypothetical protein|tara:strand:- start:2013 stop:2318 length:306 start_codon:yes stop_codon:yes gene_type:complete